MIWKISQSINNGYDTYDSAIVVAPSPEAARLIHPAARDGDHMWREVDGELGWAMKKVDGTWMNYRDDSWCRPDKVQVELIGVATGGDHGGVVCASYNAG